MMLKRNKKPLKSAKKGPTQKGSDAKWHTIGKYIALGWGSELPRGSATDFTTLGKSTSPKYNNIKEQNNRTVNKDKGTAQDAEPPIPYKEIIDYLNRKTGAHYKPSSKANQIKLIKD